MQFQRESVSQTLLTEIAPLLTLHFSESEHFKDITLEPNFEAYTELDALGFLRVFTVRIDKELVGYSILFVMPSYHYKNSIQATHDVLFVKKEHRGLGRSFIQYCDSELRNEGVQVVYQSVKLAANFGPMLERIGYQHVDNVYYRRLDRGI